MLDQIERDFEVIYKPYPKKRGKAEALEAYRHYVTDGKTSHGKRYKFTREQIYYAVQRYIHQMEEDGTDLKYYKDFSTLMNNIMDYVKEEQ